MLVNYIGRTLSQRNRPFRKWERITKLGTIFEQTKLFSAFLHEVTVTRTVKNIQIQSAQKPCTLCTYI